MPTIEKVELSYFNEIRQAYELLKCFYNQKINPVFYNVLMDNKVFLYINRDSGELYLCDEDENIYDINPYTGMIDIVIFCPECGMNGFIQDFEEYPSCDYCKQVAKDIKDIYY